MWGVGAEKWASPTGRAREGRAEGQGLWLRLTYVTGNMQAARLCVCTSGAVVWLVLQGCAPCACWQSLAFSWEIPDLETWSPLWTKSSLGEKKKKVVYRLNRDSWPVIRAGRDLWISLIFPFRLQMKILRLARFRNVLKETSWVNIEEGLKVCLLIYLVVTSWPLS